MAAGSGPAVAALCRLGDLHAPGEGATDGSLSTVLRNAVGFSFAPTSHASAFLGSLGEGFHGFAVTVRENGGATRFRNKDGREIVFLSRSTVCSRSVRRTRLHGERRDH